MFKAHDPFLGKLTSEGTRDGKRHHSALTSTTSPCSSYSYKVEISSPSCSWQSQSSHERSWALFHKRNGLDSRVITCHPQELSSAVLAAGTTLCFQPGQRILALHLKSQTHILHPTAAGEPAAKPELCNRPLPLQQTQSPRPGRTGHCTDTAVPGLGKILWDTSTGD